MRFPRSEPKRQLLDPILPLINIVFLLLVFVMMMSRVEGMDSYDISPPVSSSEAPAGEREKLLLLTREGIVFLGDKEMDDAALLHYARERKQPDEIIKIKADAKVDATRLIALMETLRLGGVENLVLLTEKRN